MDTTTILQISEPDNPKTKASQKVGANSAGQVICNQLNQTTSKAQRIYR